ncbi:hypothetical protein E3T54_02975 [Cryobacterium sp. Sr8]|uniref:hypothetical protein n=1 Tax=Cryobacterium sp. Sr8 TaxID=1259203 RepID=UPI00106BC8F3|nr:hypothetical protein [Cryobacterium sp. Sr8]TFD80720.1 hypothetical protein E3T54_02975 [Cryobacterium sp. Sr8]
MAQPGSISSLMPPSEDTQLRRIADLERFVRELGPSIAKSFQTTTDGLAKQIAQMNSNSYAATNVQFLSGSDLVTANQPVATATFVKPAWATRCTVMAISAVTTNTTSQTTAPLSGSARTVVAGTASVAFGIETKATEVYTTKVIPLARSFASATDITVETQVTTTGGAAGNALSAQLAVTVFWYA